LQVLRYYTNGTEFDRIAALLEHFLNFNEKHRRQQGQEDNEEDVSIYWKT
jgi:hypothetical protein